MFDWMKF